MAEIPRRVSLQDQIVELMRDGILAARWKEQLPPESELCLEFQVSRMTLRKALAQLAGERWIELGGRGRFHRICRRPRKAAAASGRSVRLLTPFAFAELSSSFHAIIKVISDRLAKNGYRLEIECHPGVFKRYRAAELAQLNALPDTAGWILCYATPAIQRWFAGCGRPAVVLGRLAEGVTLSAIYPDGEALARHAAGLFTARGHRRMVYLIAKVTSLSDRLISEVFAAEAKRLGAHAAVVEYEMEPAAVTRCLLDLVASRPRPTAFLVGAPETAVSVLCHLQAAGIRVPTEASVVAAWDDFHLEYTFPAITRYRVNAGSIGRRTAETILGLIRHGTGKVRSIGVIPEFVAAGSLNAGA